MSSVAHDVTAPPQVLLAYHLKSLKLPTFARVMLPLKNVLHS